ncbi:MAG: divergent PAP2 family protein [Lachnospiraceae bacterium]|nr:divergent PAP2 family protein [Lachnospiraceae bacterium]
MDFFNELFHNPVLMSAVSSWFIAQIMKAILHTCLTRSFIPERLIGTGGMPSSHSATVTGLATSVLITKGPGSVEFALAASLAIIVMYDALGIRRQAGKHAQVLNEMMETMERMEEIDWNSLSPDERLKEFLGHTPLQVAVGVVIGIGMALIMCGNILPTPLASL